MKKSCAVIGGIAALAGVAGAEREAARNGHPVVVEMFLSQSCKKSPGAATLMHEIARRDDVVALAWHVDYWDATPADGSGAWIDPFAKPEFGERQRKYNARIRRSAMVSTPQAIIDGASYAVGSNLDKINERISAAKAHDSAGTSRLDIAHGADETFRVKIAGVVAPYDAYAVSFRPRAVTEVESGDNADLTFDELNVVTEFTMLASGVEGASTHSFPRPAEGEDCAVLVQERDQGRIVAARYCDDPSAD